MRRRPSYRCTGINDRDASVYNRMHTHDNSRVDVYKIKRYLYLGSNISRKIKYAGNDEISMPRSQESTDAQSDVFAT